MASNKGGRGDITPRQGKLSSSGKLATNRMAVRTGKSTSGDAADVPGSSRGKVA